MINEDWDKVKKALLAGMSPDKAATVNTVLDNSRASMRKRDWFWSMKHIMWRMKYLIGVELINPFKKVLLPIMRRVIPQVIATEVVGVQPMATPSANIFTLRYKYSDDRDMNIHDRFSREMTRIVDRIWKRIDAVIHYRKYRRIRRQMDEAREFHNKMRAQLDNSMRVPAEYLGTGK